MCQLRLSRRGKAKGNKKKREKMREIPKMKEYACPDVKCWESCELSVKYRKAYELRSIF